MLVFFFFKQKTAYEVRISDWSSDVCSSDLGNLSFEAGGAAIEGLDLALELDSLLPLASAAGQRLTIARLEAGVAAESIELIFSLDQAPRPQLHLEDGGFELGGAPWRQIGRAHV